MRKVGSRVVVVDGHRYRWRVRRSPTYSQAAYATALTYSVQREDGGSVLMVVAKGPRPDNWLGHQGAVITPAVVVAAIRQALSAGWQAGKAGPVFELTRKLTADPDAETDRQHVATFGLGDGPAAADGVDLSMACEPMIEATIRFEGDAFHLVKWTECLRHLGFRLYGGIPERAVYVSGGNEVLAESQGFVTKNGSQGYEWRVTVKLTQRWEGTIKFCAVLLAAFTLPQAASVALANRVFTERQRLRAHAEAAIIRDFSLEELIDHGAYREGDGVQFL